MLCYVMYKSIELKKNTEVGTTEHKNNAVHVQQYSCVYWNDSMQLVSLHRCSMRQPFPVKDKVKKQDNIDLKVDNLTLFHLDRHTHTHCKLSKLLCSANQYSSLIKRQKATSSSFSLISLQFCTSFIKLLSHK